MRIIKLWQSFYQKIRKRFKVLRYYGTFYNTLNKELAIYLDGANLRCSKDGLPLNGKFFTQTYRTILHYKNGKLHNEYGPAIIYDDLDKSFYLYGTHFNRDEYYLKLKFINPDAANKFMAETLSNGEK